ncbi:MAG: HNH endonuclease, partial [Chloroflexota bacterium]
RCNEFKGRRTGAVDPASGEHVPLFNPRKQTWGEHFCWSQDGTQIIGISSIGRATVEALRLNNDLIMAARRRWVAVGWHPPP